MEMEREQCLEWKKAQSIDIQVDLVAAAKTQLKFLAAVDRKRWLYEGPGLETAIYRYNACWLPLLAKHCESLLLEGQFVVPLDCEWIWHCHRLNPIRYKKDCEALFGRILDNRNVVSSVEEGVSTVSSEEIWREHFSSEPYELDMANGVQNRKRVIPERCTGYDFISAVQRQAPFFYQVSRPHMVDDRYIKASVARYKAFLHLIRRNKEKGLNSFSVPTYDIDLIWHTHQLHPVSYCKDLMETMGKVLEHDDTDSDRSKGQKLDVGFSETTKLYEEMYGARYWRAGAMYRGSAPKPVRISPYSGISCKMTQPSNENQNILAPAVDVFEVMLEFISVRNLPERHNGNLSVVFSKREPDVIFNTKRGLAIFSETGAKQAASFQCQPTGEFVFELVNSPPGSLHKSPETLGVVSLPLKDLFQSDLVVEEWLELAPTSHTNGSSLPVSLRVAVSVTVPTSAPYELCMIHSRPILKSSFLFPLKMPLQFGKRRCTRVVDNAGNTVLSLHLKRDKQSKGKGGSRTRVFLAFPGSRERSSLLEFSDSGWSMMNSPWSFKLPNPSSSDQDGHFLELTGPQAVRLYPGGRLDYEPKGCQKHKTEGNLVTAMEFSSENPYGRAVALLDLMSGDIKFNDESFIIPGILVMFMLSKQAIRPGHEGFASHPLPLIREEKVEAPKDEGFTTVKTGTPLKGGCGSGCGGGCGGCGGGCGNVLKPGSGGCGGCGAGGCGTMEKGNRAIK